MRLVDLTCPKCGATIKIDQRHYNYICEYCKSQLYLESDALMESKGRSQQQVEEEHNNSAPTERVREELCSYLLNMEISLKSAERRYSEYIEMKRQYERIGNASKIVTLGGGFLVGCILAVPILSIFGRIISPIKLLFALWIFFPIYFYMRNRKKQVKKEELKEQTKALFKQYADKMEKLEGDLAAIPSEFWYSEAVRGLFVYIRNGSTLDLNEAAEQYRADTMALKTDNPEEALKREMQKQAFVERKNTLDLYKNGHSII